MSIHSVLHKKLLLFILPIILLSTVLFIPSHTFAESSTSCTQNGTIPASNFAACESIQTDELGFKIPSLADILTFAIRAFFVIAGIAALFYMLIGAFAWVTSGGDKDAVGAAREKIQAAVIGMILIVAVLAIIWTLEQVIFRRRICLGLSCPLTLPGLIESTGTASTNCCVCVHQTSGDLGDVIDTFTMACDENGVGVNQ